MKRVLGCIFAIVFFVVMSVGVLAYEFSYKVEPNPVEPGEKFTLYLVVKDSRTDIDTTKCTIIQKYPFSLYGGSSDIERLASGTGFSEDIEIKVDENALEGDEEIEIRCSSNLIPEGWLIEEIPIKIQNRFSILNIVSARTDPEPLRIGEPGMLIFGIQNGAESAIRDVTATIDFSNLQISSADGAISKRVKNINRNEIRDVSFNIIALPDASPGFYKIPVLINYTTGDGSGQSFYSILTLKVHEPPQYYVVVDSFARGSGGTDVKLKFVNYGKSDLKFFDFRVLENEQIQSVTNSRVYVGDLDSDDYVTETFSAKIAGNFVKIPIEVSYRDSLYVLHTDKILVDFDMSRVKNTSSSSSGVFIGVIVVILIIVVGIIVYRKRKRKF